MKTLLSSVTTVSSGSWVDVPSGDWGLYTQVLVGTASVEFEWRPSADYAAAPLEDANGTLVHTLTAAAKLSIGDIPSSGQVRAKVTAVSGSGSVTVLLVPHLEHKTTGRPIPEQYS